MTNQNSTIQDMAIRMKNFRVNETIFRRKGKMEGSELINQYAYSMKIDNEAKICAGNIAIQVYADGYENNIEESPLYIKLDMTGKFSFTDAIEPAILSVETFRELFPYARALVTTLTTSAGMPPMILPAIQIKAEDVNVKKEHEEE